MSNAHDNAVQAASVSGLWFKAIPASSAPVVAEPIIGGSAFETVRRELPVTQTPQSRAGRPASTVPTPGEIEILQVLWQYGPMTVRDVHEVLVQKRRVAHTTVASMMQIMEDKDQLELVSRRRPFRYVPVLGPDEAKDALLGDIQTRMFAGSMTKMAMHLLESKGMSKEQRREIEKLLGALE